MGMEQPGEPFPMAFGQEEHADFPMYVLLHASATTLNYVQSAMTLNYMQFWAPLTLHQISIRPCSRTDSQCSDSGAVGETVSTVHCFPADLGVHKPDSVGFIAVGTTVKTL